VPGIDISTWVLEAWFGFNFNAGNSLAVFTSER
jgi:hypothetical protein